MTTGWLGEIWCWLMRHGERAYSHGRFYDSFARYWIEFSCWRCRKCGRRSYLYGVAS